jgi:hypothetical protein
MRDHSWNPEPIFPFTLIEKALQRLVTDTSYTMTSPIAKACRRDNQQKGRVPPRQAQAPAEAAKERQMPSIWIRIC